MGNLEASKLDAAGSDGTRSFQPWRGNSMAQSLYAVFIIAALVLLVNMMIAVLSNTYERVQVIL